MNEYCVILKNECDDFYAFFCDADDIGHAIEQAHNAYPADTFVSAAMMPDNT